MKANLLPNLSRIELFDKQGDTIELQIKLYQYNGRLALFIEDSANGTLARNAGAIIGQLVRRLSLPKTQTSFYRHIFLPHQGSVFGCFQVGWGDNGGVSHYTFSMLAPRIDDLPVRRIVSEGKAVSLSYDLLHKLSPAV